MVNHGINVQKQGTSVSTPIVAESGVPFVVGIAPAHSAKNPANAGIPVLCTSWDEAVAALGYSDDWNTYTLCEFMYSHFKLFGCQPVVFCNVLDVNSAAMTKEVAAEDMTVSAKKVFLSIDALNDSSLVVKAEGGDGSLYTLNTDYATYYDGENLVIELLPDGTAYSAEKINVAYKKVNRDGVKNTDIVAGIEATELCLGKTGIIPDLLCAPGFSHDSTVAAVLSAKADSLMGLFEAKALIDIDCSANGAKTYSEAIKAKNDNNFTDKNENVMWPMLRLGEHIFHYSTQLAGLMAQVDSGNDGCPYESPSNKNLQCDGLVLADGTELNLTLAQANILNNNGIVTAINFVNGWVAWGNYTACYPANTDVKDYFIPISRVFSWVGNTLIKTFWGRLDDPMNRRLLDSIIDSANIWLNGLVGNSYLVGARVEMTDSENPLTDLMAGKVKLHLYITPPGPAQEIDFVLEYDADYVTAALS